ncbi:unnamed protein product [Parnassius apollo]|uniref:(apollo) hypothetical protein n=1 Tax=Parnassius apollo TaxID=110799 RepID=A0A8S3X6K5_PARAO|nr:unnamed protein product [Parnassius apollo]
MTNNFSIPKSHKARDEIQFTPIYHIDIWPVECGIENDCKDNIFSLESVKVEEENFENENHETEQYITPTDNFSKPDEGTQADGLLCIVVIGNAPYHNVQVSKPPSLANQKEDWSPRIVQNVDEQFYG